MTPEENGAGTRILSAMKFAECQLNIAKRHRSEFCVRMNPARENSPGQGHNNCHITARIMV
jgi:hypothetical protein